jgi:clan AA aspartic protease
MGEVKVRIKLTNNFDELLVRKKKLARSKVRSIEIDGVVDTGAVSLSLPSFVVERLGLTRMGKHVAQYADGRLEEVDVTEAVLIEIMGRTTSEEAMILGDEILIGQTVLEKTDLLVDCTRQRLIPNPAHPNQPVMKIR